MYLPCNLQNVPTLTAGASAGSVGERAQNVGSLEGWAALPGCIPRGTGGRMSVAQTWWLCCGCPRGDPAGSPALSLPAPLCHCGCLHLHLVQQDVCPRGQSHRR